MPTPPPRPPRPPRRRSASTPRSRRSPASQPSRDAVFFAAAELFSDRGFAGVGVDDIAHAARLNKAMIYYHFDSKLSLYREVVRHMLRAFGDVVTVVVDKPIPADDRLAEFIRGMIDLAGTSPWFPPLMLREMAEGAPRLDPETLALMKTVFVAFARILQSGHEAGTFRPIDPVLAYMSILGPILLNAARERTASRPGRIDLPMFAPVTQAELTTHMEQAARRLLAREPRP